jgi:hypothetical protein
VRSNNDPKVVLQRLQAASTQDASSAAYWAYHLARFTFFFGQVCPKQRNLVMPCLCSQIYGCIDEEHLMFSCESTKDIRLRFAGLPHVKSEKFDAV